jgi:hypothetical protein
VRVSVDDESCVIGSRRMPARYSKIPANSVTSYDSVMRGGSGVAAEASGVIPSARPSSPTSEKLDREHTTFTAVYR